MEHTGGLRSHPHIASILHSFSRYVAGEFDLSRLQSNVALYARALEGDVPQRARRAIEDALRELDLAGVTEGNALRAEEVEHILRAVESQIAVAEQRDLG